MATILDPYKLVKFNSDGEFLDGNDLTDLQRYAIAAQLEQLVLSSVTDAVDDPAAPGSTMDLESGLGTNSLSLTFDDLVFAPHAGAGFVIAGGAARSLTLAPGPIVCMADEPLSGTLDAVLSFRFPTGGGVTLTTAIGDGANPRIDLVEVKLEVIDDATDTAVRDHEDGVTGAPSTQVVVKGRRVQCTIQIKQGLAAAAPVYPATSVGFKAMAAVYVPALHNAVHSPANIRDLRWPLGKVTPHDVFPPSFWYPGPNAWQDFAGNEPAPPLYAIAPAAGGTIYIPCPVGGRNARLVGVGLFGRSDSGPSVTLVRVDHNLPAAPTITPLANLDASIIDDAGGFMTMSAVQLADELGTLTPGRGTRAAGTRIGTPIWCNGYPGGPAVSRGLTRERPSSHLALKVTAPNNLNFVSFARFYIAEGL